MSQLLSIPHSDILLPNCLHSKPEVILPALLQFALHLSQRDRIIIWSRQWEAFSLHGPPGPLPQETKGEQLTKKGTCKQTTEFLSKCHYAYKDSPGRLQFFWEFIGEYISVLWLHWFWAALQSRTATYLKQSLWLWFTNYFNEKSELFILRYLAYTRQAASPQPEFINHY